MSVKKYICSLIASLVFILMATPIVSASEASLFGASDRYNSLIEANYDNDFFVVNNKNVDFSQEGKAYVLVGKTVITKDTDAGNKRI